MWQYWGNKWVARKSEKIMQAKMKKIWEKVALMRKIEEKNEKKKSWGKMAKKWRW